MGQGRYAAQIGWGRGADNFFFAGGLAGGKARISLEVSSSRYLQGIVGTWSPCNTLLCFYRATSRPLLEICNYN